MPPTRGKKLRETVILKGYILPQDKTGENEADDSEEENEEEEQQQPEFLDMAEMDKVSSGGRLFHSRVPLCKVRFQTFSRDEYQVEGRFPLRGPWWEVTCFTVKQRDRLVVKGFPSYNLRSDLDRQKWIQMVSLFLTACGVEDQHKSLFLNWLPQNRDVSLNNLMEVLCEFSEGGNKDQARMIITRLSNSVAWMQVQGSSLYPGVMKYLPTLLPRQFTELFGMAKKSPTLPATQATQAGVSTQQDDDNQEEEEDLLAKLEHIIANDVWKLGFNSLVYRELKLVRCEAHLSGFEECGLLHKIPPLHRFSLMAYDQLKKHCSSRGSTYMNHKELWEIITKDEKMSDEQAWDAIHFLREQAVVVLESNVGACKVILHNFDLYETGIAKSLRTLLERGPWKIPVNPVEVLQAAAEERQQQAGTCCPIKLDHDHVQAAKMICTNPVTIISGKAGCGKTTVVSQLFRAAVLRGSCEKQDIQKDCADYENDTGGCLQSQDDEDEQRPIQSDNEILLTAPTGRAASLLSKKTHFKAYTLHQVLFRYMNKKKNLDQWEFKNVRILVVDEGSMVPVHLLHSVLSLLIKHAELRKFVILGDVRQLPSIQPGNILFDLFDGLKRVGWAIEMRTNHRSESQLIVDNAGLIADMRRWKLKYDAIVDLDGSHDALTADKKFILIRLPSNGSDDDLQRAVRSLIDTAPGLSDHTTSQFITFRRIDVSLINELCCQHYNNHTTKNHKKKLMFQPGDKVCCTRNGYVTVEGDDDGNDLNEADVTNETQSPEKKREKSSMRLCNGEIFFIRADTTKEDGKQHSRSLTLDDGDGRVFTVDFRELQRECRLQHAWARTIHTYQGSENETIVYVVGDSRAQSWKHIYTAITRGQKRVYVVSREQAIKLAIKEDEIKRKTRLSSLVKNQLVDPSMLLGIPEAQPNTPKGTPTSCCPTPLHTQTPGRSSSFNFKSTPLQPKCLLKDYGKQEEAAQTSAGASVCSLSAMNSSRDHSAEQLATREATKGDKERHSAAMSAGHKRQRTLSAEHEEVPCKQSLADCY